MRRADRSWQRGGLIYKKTPRLVMCCAAGSADTYRQRHRNEEVMAVIIARFVSNVQKAAETMLIMMNQQETVAIERRSLI